MDKPFKILIAPPHGKTERQMYVDWLIKYGFDPHFLENNSQIIDAPLLLCGGPDIGVNNIRDENELEWIRLALENKQPIIGICRGMQILNYYYGSVVINIPNELLENHLNDSFDDDNDHSHRISKYHAIIDNNQKINVVNSRHHQYCPKLAKNFKQTHVSLLGGNLIEGFIDSKKNIWAIQWHPERDECDDNEYPLNRLKKLLTFYK